jgi:hypothetical protein
LHSSIRYRIIPRLFFFLLVLVFEQLVAQKIDVPTLMPRSQAVTLFDHCSRARWFCRLSITLGRAIHSQQDGSYLFRDSRMFISISRVRNPFARHFPAWCLHAKRSQLASFKFSHGFPHLRMPFEPRNQHDDRETYMRLHDFSSQVRIQARETKCSLLTENGMRSEPRY